MRKEYVNPVSQPFLFAALAFFTCLIDIKNRVFADLATNTRFIDAVLSAVFHHSIFVSWTCSTPLMLFPFLFLEAVFKLL